MLRLAAALAALWPAAAWADPASDAASLASHAGENIANSGLLGSIAVIVGLAATAIIVVQFLQNRGLAKELTAANRENGELRDRRGNEADARAERFANVVTSSVTTGEKLIAAIAGLDSRTKDIGEVVAQLPALGEATLKGLDRNADKFDRAYEAARNAAPAVQPARGARS